MRFTTNLMKHVKVKMRYLQNYEYLTVFYYILFIIKKHTVILNAVILFL